MSEIEVHDVLSRGSRYHVPEDLTGRTFVRFPVRPPLARHASDRGGGIDRLHESEGRIDVSITDDGSGIEIRGRRPLVIEVSASNSLVIRLADDPLRPGEVQP